MYLVYEVSIIVEFVLWLSKQKQKSGKKKGNPYSFSVFKNALLLVHHFHTQQRNLSQVSDFSTRDPTLRSAMDVIRNELKNEGVYNLPSNNSATENPMAITVAGCYSQKEYECAVKKLFKSNTSMFYTSL